MQPENPYEPPGSANYEFPLQPYPIAPISHLLTSLVLWSVFGSILGATSRLVRDRMRGSVHYEAIAELAIKAIACLIILFLARRFRIADSIRHFTGNVSALWITSAVAWTIINSRVFTEHILANTTGLIISLVIGLPLLFPFRSRTPIHDVTAATTVVTRPLDSASTTSDPLNPGGGTVGS